MNRRKYLMKILHVHNSNSYPKEINIGKRTKFRVSSSGKKDFEVLAGKVYSHKNFEQITSPFCRQTK